MIKVLIVDNELLAGVRMERLLTAMQNIIFVGQATSGAKAVDMVAAQSPDIVLMKTPMLDMDRNSFPQFFNRAESNPVVVFCPTLDQLDSGSQKDSLVDAILIACKAVHSQRRAMAAGARSHLYAYSYQGVDSVPVEQIGLLKADQKYVRVYTADTDFIINETLKGLEQEFAHLFVRIHRNALVAKDALQSIRRDDGCIRAALKDIDIQPEISRRLEPKLRKLTSQL
ncbi:MAG: LytTR family transcriptional regulator DNA-binding domain-containing protein [Porticoccaceae bacterium]|nr:LytTR family transcriptional regulator DNA-binding domain-containing protein [Porticoccaceae bacterium]